MIALARIALALSCIAALAGCASTLSGLSGSDKYACKAPQGVLCTSVAGVYANSVENNLPSQRIEQRAGEPGSKTTSPARTVPTLKPASDGAALRSSSRILRLWVAPWEDSDGDLHEQSLLYVVVDSGRWLIEHKRSAIRDEFMPIAAPRTTPPIASEQGTSSGREQHLPLPLGGMIPPAAGGPARDEEQPDAK
jgi:conjugal transfer pilus assembly protein TraV